MTRMQAFRYVLVLTCCAGILDGLALAQESTNGIRAYVENDKAYIAPGESDILWVRVVNPANSGVVIHRLQFSLSREDITLLENRPEMTLRDSHGCPMRQRLTRPLQIPRGDTQEDCHRETLPGLPLHPGESTRVPYREIEPGPDTRPGTVIEFNQVRIRLFDGQDRQLPDLYPDRNFVRLVAPVHERDGGRLAGYDTDNPLAGSAPVQMSLQLEAPARVAAGEPFVIKAAVTNHGSETMTVYPQLSSLGYSSLRYRSLPCLPGTRRCESAGLHDVAAGESLTLELTMMPESPILRSGIWEMAAPSMMVQDSLEREARLYAEPIRVVVSSDSHLPVLAPDYQNFQ